MHVGLVRNPHLWLLVAHVASRHDIQAAMVLARTRWKTDPSCNCILDFRLRVRFHIIPFRLSCSCRRQILHGTCVSHLGWARIVIPNDACRLGCDRSLSFCAIRTRDVIVDLQVRRLVAHMCAPINFKVDLRLSGGERWEWTGVVCLC